MAEYYIAGGTLTFKAEGASSAVDVGDVQNVTLSQNVETAQALTYRDGREEIAEEAIVKTEYTLKFNTTNIDKETLKRAFLATEETSGDDIIIKAGKTNHITGEAVFTSKPLNDGTVQVWTIPKVSLSMDGDFGLLSPKEFASVDFTGKVIKVSGEDPFTIKLVGAA